MTIKSYLYEDVPWHILDENDAALRLKTIAYSDFQHISTYANMSSGIYLSIFVERVGENENMNWAGILIPFMFSPEGNHRLAGLKMLTRAANKISPKDGLYAFLEMQNEIDLKKITNKHVTRQAKLAHAVDNIVSVLKSLL